MFAAQDTTACAVALSSRALTPVGVSGFTLSTVAEVRGVYANLTFAAPVQATKSTRSVCLPEGTVRATDFFCVDETFFHASILRTPSR
ncbi:hypothetical protein [Streptomyces sp. NPDC051997]|uniref:hypothetical protein n=1 Tax=Streptomyces sp. NPDC051997 TaxID=3155611 RepID=UPI003429BAA8